MSEAKPKRKSKSKRNSPRLYDADDLPMFMQPLLLQARSKANAEARTHHRPKSEILRELRRLRATPMRPDDDDDDGQLRAKPPPSKPVRTLEQLDALRLTRHRIMQLHSCSSFEQVVSNCFVRLNVNAIDVLPEYRIAEIVQVEELPEGYYVDKLATNIVLHLRYEDIVARHELNDVSNVAFTREEFELWRDNCICQAIEFPSTELVARKKIELYNALNSEQNKQQSPLPRNNLLTASMPMRPVPRGGLLERFGGTYPWQLQRPAATDLRADGLDAIGSSSDDVELETLNEELEAQRLDSMMPSGDRKSKFG